MEEVTLMFIVVEGIDCSGKTSVCKAIAKQTDFRFEHEPTFSSEYADSLNFKKLDAYQREFHFMLDRYKHQEVFTKYKNLIFDRYRLTGAVYASIFGPEALPMVHSIYGMPEFKKPDLTIFLDTVPSHALQLNELKKGTDEYSPHLTYENLSNLRFAFFDQIDIARKLWGENIILISNPFGAFQETVQNVKNIILNKKLDFIPF